MPGKPGPADALNAACWGTMLHYFRGHTNRKGTNMALQDLSKLWKMIEDNYLATDAESLQQSLARHMEFSQAKTRVN